MENKKYSELNVINTNRTVTNNTIPTKQREIPQNNRRRKKKINKASLLKRRLVFATTAISLSAVSVKLIDSAIEYLEEQNIVSNAIEEYSSIIKENTHVLRDENGKPIYNGTDVMIMIDTNNVGNWIEEQLEQGANETAVVYGVYSNLPVITEKENNFYDILDAANLPVDWAIENGYTGMDDKNLKKAAKQEYINEYYNTNIEEKNIGGR